MLTDPEDDYGRGWVPFLETTIYLDSKPLIPRVETEYWTEKAIEEIKRTVGEVSVLDLFAGSGAIGVATLAHVPHARVDFGEIDTSHFPTIQKNVRENIQEGGTIAGRAHIRETDVWSDVPGRYDFVLANPPYIRDDADVDESVTKHEPARALFAEEGGLRFIKELVQGLSAHLTKEGVLYLEHDPDQTAAIQALGHGHGFTVESFPDQYGVVRFSRMTPMA